jgi:hypothetical protein
MTWSEAFLKQRLYCNNSLIDWIIAYVLIFMLEDAVVESNNFAY